jgi:hypothetical protein
LDVLGTVAVGLGIIQVFQTVHFLKGKLFRTLIGYHLVADSRLHPISFGLSNYLLQFLNIRDRYLLIRLGVLSQTFLDRTLYIAQEVVQQESYRFTVDFKTLLYRNKGVRQLQLDLLI